MRGVSMKATKSWFSVTWVPATVYSPEVSVRSSRRSILR